MSKTPSQVPSNEEPSQQDLQLRCALVKTAQALTHARLNTGSAGNVSARCPGGMLITPSGVAATDLTPDTVAFVDDAGRASGPLAPSSEWRFHNDVYRQRCEAHAIVHTHAPFATALACQRITIPAFHYMIARFGGPSVRCARYATFGTQALSEHISAALQDRSACLIANHGMLVFDQSLSRALDAAIEFESLCEQYWRTLQLGPPVLLSDAEMAEVIERFRWYGKAQAAAASDSNQCEGTSSG